MFHIPISAKPVRSNINEAGSDTVEDGRAPPKESRHRLLLGYIRSAARDIADVHEASNQVVRVIEIKRRGGQTPTGLVKRSAERLKAEVSIGGSVQIKLASGVAIRLNGVRTSPN